MNDAVSATPEAVQTAPGIRPSEGFALRSLFWRVYGRLSDASYHLMPYRKLLWDVYSALDLKPGMRILVVGRGAGLFERFVWEKGAERIGIESHELSRSGALNFPHTPMLKYLRPGFAHIVCLDLMWRAEDPDSWLHAFDRVLSPGGKIVLTESGVDAALIPVVRKHIGQIGNIWGFRRRLRALLKVLVAVPARLLVGIVNTRASAGASFSLKHDFVKLLRMKGARGMNLTPALAGQGRVVQLSKGSSSRLDEQPGPLVFKVAENALELKLAQELRFDVLCARRGYLSVLDYQGGRETDEYDAASTHFVSFDARGKPVGTARLILESRAGLQIERYFGDVRKASGLAPNAKVAEMSRLCVEQHHEVVRRGVAFGLYKVAYDFSIEHRINDWFAILDQRLHRRYRRLGFTFVRVGEPANLLGGFTAPYVLDLSSMMRSLERENPRLFAFLSGSFGGIVGEFTRP